MAATDQPYRSQYSLDVVFGVSSILMLLSVIWMFAQDYNREYKAEQRPFRDVEAAMAQRSAIEQLPSHDEFMSKLAAVDKARNERDQNEGKIQEFSKQVKSLLPKKEEKEVEFQAIKSELESRLSFYDIEVEKNPGSDLSKRYLKEAEAFAEKLDKVQGTRDEIVGEIRALRVQKDKLERDLTKKLSDLKKVNDKFDAQLRLAKNKEWGWGDTIRMLPIIDGFAAPIKIHQITNNDVPIDYNFKYVTRFDRCMSCHLGIDRPTFTRENLRGLIDTTGVQEERLKSARRILETRKTYLEGLPDAAAVPDPDELKLSMLSRKVLTEARITEYAAHPRLDLFVGATSKHPAEKFGCSACHSGQGSATSFTLASHTPNDAEAKERWIKQHGWEHIHMWDFPMQPKRFTESACLKCHYQVTDLYSSDGRNEAPKVLRGYDIIREFGCFGCHEIHGRKGGRDIGPDLRLEPSPALEELTPLERLKAESDPDNPPGRFRKVGPSLARLDEKTNAEWIARWLKSPRSFRPDTKMPHFYGLSNNDPKVLADSPEAAGQVEFPDAEMWLVAQFLMESSKRYLAEAATLRKEGNAALQKDEAQVLALQLKGKITEEEKTELAKLQRRVRLRQTPPLADLAPNHKGDVAKGRQLFIERGCLACHSHQGTAKSEPGSPGVMSEAQFGPNLSQVAEKLGASKGDKKSARRWLTQWIVDPHVHSPRSRMPVTHLTADEAADIAEWLLSQPAQDLGDDWNSIAVAKPAPETLKNLARVYLVRILSKRDMNKLLDGEPLSQVVKDDLPKDEQALATGAETLEHYLGRKTVTRLGCYACHDVPGMENIKPIGVGLNDWGKKPADRLAFEDIANFIREKYHVVSKLTDEHGKPNAHVKVVERDGKQVRLDPYEEFFAEMLDHHHRAREGYLHQKLVDPRSYDFKRVRAWDDRARMPQFRFARLRKKPGESAQEFEARSYKEEADAREAVMTFILGLVAEQVPPKSTNQPTGDRLAEVKGRQVLDNFNCAGCHLIRPGVYDFKVTPDSLKVMLSKAGNGPSDQVFPNHYNWTGMNAPATDTATALGLIKKRIPAADDEPEDPAKLRQRVLLSHALRLGTPKGPVDITSFSSLAIQSVDFVPSTSDAANKQVAALRDDAVLRFKEMSILDEGTPVHKKAVEAYEHALTSYTEALNRHMLVNPAFGGAFADLLTFYEHRKNPKDYARGADGDSARGRLLVPPSLIGQGERTQPEWLYQFLLNPYPVRKMSVLRMPKFNMSGDDAKALVNYFGAVERRHNPGIGLTFPFETIHQQDPANESIWRQKSIEYVARLQNTPSPDPNFKNLLDKKVDELKPAWTQILKENQAQFADAQSKFKAWKERADASEKATDEAKKKSDAAKQDAKLQAEFDKLKEKSDAEAKQLEIWKSQVEELTARVANSSLEKQEASWKLNDAYLTDAYRLVMNRTLCLQCHSIGPIETKNEIMGPPLTNAHKRLRPGWLERWIANPQKFVPYESSMPMNFPADKPAQFQEYFVGTPQERAQAARDLLMVLPRVEAMPISRHLVLQLPPGEKK